MTKLPMSVANCVKFCFGNILNYMEI